MGAPDEPAPGFDLNEFPSLGGPPLPNARGPGAQFGHGVGGGLGMGPGPQMGGMFGGMDGMGSADGYGVVALQKPHPEFTIQNEDFPALPGAPGGGGGGPPQAGRRQGRPIRPAGELPAHVSRRFRGVPESRRRRGAERTRRRARSRHRGRVSRGGWRRTLRRRAGRARRAVPLAALPGLRRVFAGRLRLRRRWGRGNAFGFLGGEGRGSA